VNGRIVLGRFVPRETIDICFLVAVPDSKASHSFPSDCFFIKPFVYIIFYSYDYYLEFGLLHSQGRAEHDPLSDR